MRGRRGGSQVGEFCHGLPSGTHLKFDVNATNMSIDSGDSNAQMIGNLFVEIAGGEKLQNLPFAWSQIFDAAGGRALPPERLNHFPSDVAAHGGAAGVDILHGGDQLFRGSSLEQIPLAPVASALNR